MDKDKARRALEHLTWLKISLDAGREETYSVIHGTKKEDFSIVINNLKEAIKVRERNHYSCTIGTQFLLMPGNYKEVIILSRLLSDLGVDYLVIKPYCQHPSSKYRIKPNFKYENLMYLESKLKKYCRDDFQIIFRRNAMEKFNRVKPYKHCLGLLFTTHITAKGDIYPCNVFLGKEEFIFGNIYKDNFKIIWEGPRRRGIMDRIYQKWDIEKCRNACRLDEVNRYLWELKNPGSHVNFI